jgi:hypothetical protein
LNGRTKGDLIGQFTCQTYNGASVVDYAIVSTGIMQSIHHLTVSEITEFSHHCSLSFALEVEPQAELETEETLQLSPLPASFVWSDVLKNTLRENLVCSNISNEMNSIFKSPQEIDSLVSEFTTIIVNASKSVVRIRNRLSTKKRQKVTVQKQKWFNTSCHLLKKEVRNLGLLLSKYPDDPFLRHKFFSTKKKITSVSLNV